MLADAHYDIGFVEMMDRNADGLRAHEEEALRLYEQLGDADGASAPGRAWSSSASSTGDFVAARDRRA